MRLALLRTDSTNPDFVELVKQLDAYLAVIDGEEHGFYDQFNKIQHLKYVVVAYHEGVAVGCGAINSKEDAMEVKRMFVNPNERGKGMAKKILGELEKWAGELGYTKCVLETGKRQVEAVELYKGSGYQVIPNYEPYTDMDNSICFSKKIG